MVKRNCLRTHITSA